MFPIKTIPHSIIKNFEFEEYNMTSIGLATTDRFQFYKVNDKIHCLQSDNSHYLCKRYRFETDKCTNLKRDDLFCSECWEEMNIIEDDLKKAFQSLYSIW